MAALYGVQSMLYARTIRKDKAMGSKYREPRPKSAEKLRLQSIDSAGFEKDSDGYSGDVVTVRATFTYYTWCCNDSHEIADAVVALQDAITSASESAYRKRMKGASKEVKELREELRDSGQV
jgi:hypothetical protein